MLACDEAFADGGRRSVLLVFGALLAVVRRGRRQWGQQTIRAWREPMQARQHHQTGGRDRVQVADAGQWKALLHVAGQPWGMEGLGPALRPQWPWQEGRRIHDERRATRDRDNCDGARSLVRQPSDNGISRNDPRLGCSRLPGRGCIRRLNRSRVIAWKGYRRTNGRRLVTTATLRTTTFVWRTTFTGEGAYPPASRVIPAHSGSRAPSASSAAVGASTRRD